MLNQIRLTIAIALALACTAIAAAPPSATEAIRTSVGTVLEILQDEQLDKAGKREKIRATIKNRFDFRAMSQRTLATNWKKLSSDEKQNFTTLFSKLIENSYVGKLETYTDEKVEYPGEKVKGRKAVVDTLIITSSAEIPVNYRLYLKNENWLVYDIVIEGVSLISNYRSSYQAIFKKEGLDGLLARMEQKIRELQNTAS